MTEYIDKAEAISALTSSADYIADALERLDKIPIADVQPVKHGRWIIDNPQYLLSYCSECQCFNSIGYKWKYCPNCGATMDGETDG